MGEVPADVMEATWVAIASFSGSRGRSETKRAQREQPYLFEFVLSATEQLSPAVHALGFYIFLVIWHSVQARDHRQDPSSHGWSYRAAASGERAGSVSVPESRRTVP
jgi:hypothetical protein